MKVLPSYETTLVHILPYLCLQTMKCIVNNCFNFSVVEHTFLSSSTHSSQHLKMAHSFLLPLLLSLLLSLLTTIFCQTRETISIAYTRRDSVYHPTQVMLSCTTNRMFNHDNFYFFRNISGHIDRVVVNMSTTAQLPGRQQMILNFDVTPELEGVYSCVNNNVTSGNSVELIGE